MYVYLLYYVCVFMFLKGVFYMCANIYYVSYCLFYLDTWLREYQVLPGRFHPHMNMATSGGYLLTGIYLGAPII